MRLLHHQDRTLGRLGKLAALHPALVTHQSCRALVLELPPPPIQRRRRHTNQRRELRGRKLAPEPAVQKQQALLPREVLKPRFLRLARLRRAPRLARGDKSGAGGPPPTLRLGDFVASALLRRRAARPPRSLSSRRASLSLSPARSRNLGKSDINTYFKPSAGHHYVEGDIMHQCRTEHGVAHAWMLRPRAAK